VTIAVLAIVAGMATPSMINIVRKQRLITDAYDFINLAVQLRSEAILFKKEKKIGLPISGDVQWSPSPHNDWEVKPQGSLSYNMFGNLTIDQQCFILKSKNDSSLKAVIIVRKSGTITFNKQLSACPV
jgi:Tfp pilus assembly protein FimT